MSDLQFQSTPSGGKATYAATKRVSTQCSFNPRLPGGRRLPRAAAGGVGSGFQSTPSGGKATYCVVRAKTAAQFQSTPSGVAVNPACPAASSCFNPRLPGGRRRLLLQASARCPTVSIHAFRGEGDRTPRVLVVQRPVSIHAFRGEGDPTCTPLYSPTPMFQSTPSGGKATQYLGLLCPVPARYCSMIRIFRVALGTICPYIRFLRCC